MDFKVKCKKLSESALKYRKEIRHCRAIIDGLLYNTETAIEFVGLEKCYVTPNKRFFKVDIETYDEFSYHDGIKIQTTVYQYCNIRPFNREELREYLGKYDVDKYIEIFGEVEEA